jgi:WD40 repeat protein
VAGGKELARFNGHRGVCRSAAISPDGKTAVSVARVEEGEKVKGEAKVWNAETGEEIASLTTPRELFKVAYRPDGRQIAAYGVNLQAGLGHDADLVLWDHTAGTHTVNALPKSDAISFSSRCLNYSPDSTRIVSGCGSDGALRVWEAASGIELHNLKGHPAEVMEAAFTPDGHRLFSIGLDDPELFEWDLTRPLWERDVPIPDAQPNGIYSVALSPDGKLAAMEFPPRRILIWDVDHGKVSRTLDTPSQRVLGFTPDGRRLLTSEWLDNNTLTVWDTATWSTKNAWPLPRETTATEQSSAVSPDGSRVFLAMSDGGTRAYDLESGREVGRYEWTGGKLGPNDAGAMLHRFSPDGRYLATREGDPLVVRDVSDGTVVTRIENNPGDNFTFLSDSRLLTCDSGRFKVWELPSGRLLQTAPCLTPAQSLTLLPGGDRVAGYTIAGVRTFNYTLRVWETTSWNEVLALPTPPTVSLGVSADGRRIVVGSNTLRIWDAPGMPAGRGGGGSR